MTTVRAEWIATLRRVPLFRELSEDELGEVARRVTRREYPAGAAQLYIDGENCICCGACVPVCPVSAIHLAEELPEKWKEYEQENTEWYRTKHEVIAP
jgi:ferredoxin